MTLRFSLQQPVPPIHVTLEERLLKALETQSAAMTVMAEESVKQTEFIGQQTGFIGQQTEFIGQQTEFLGQIAKKLRRAFPSDSARGFAFHLIKELEMDSIVFTLSADAPDPDVVTRELTLVFGAGTADEKTVVVNGKKDTVLFDKDDSGTELQGPQDSTVNASLVDIDDGGNRAEPATLAFTLVDSFPPVSASGFGVKFVREIPE